LRGEVALAPFQPLIGQNLFLGIGGNLLTLARNLIGVSFTGTRNLATFLLVSRPSVIDKALFLTNELAGIEQNMQLLEEEIQGPPSIFTMHNPQSPLQEKKDRLLSLKQEINDFLLNIPEGDLDSYGSLELVQCLYGSDEAVVGEGQYRKLLKAREKAEREDLQPPAPNQRIEDLNNRRAILEVGGEASKNAAIGIALCGAAKISIIGAEKAEAFAKQAVESSTKAKEQFIEEATKAAEQTVEKISDAYADLGKKVADSLARVYINVDENTILPKIAGAVVGIGLATFAAYKLGMFRRRPDPAV